jgi:hypothetical protein
MDRVDQPCFASWPLRRASQYSRRWRSKPGPQIQPELRVSRPRPNPIGARPKPQRFATSAQSTQLAGLGPRSPVHRTQLQHDTERRPAPRAESPPAENGFDNRDTTSAGQSERWGNRAGERRKPRTACWLGVCSAIQCPILEPPRLKPARSKHFPPRSRKRIATTGKVGTLRRFAASHRPNRSPATVRLSACSQNRIGNSGRDLMT